MKIRFGIHCKARNYAKVGHTILSKENRFLSRLCAGIAVAAVMGGVILVFLCVGQTQDVDGYIILNGYSEAMTVKQRLPPDGRSTSSKIKGCTTTRNFSHRTMNIERMALSELINFSVIFAFLTTACQRDVEATFDIIPALLVSGGAGTGKSRTVDDIIMQLRGLGIHAACCDAEVALDEASFIGEGQINKTVGWQMPSPFLHSVMAKAAATKGLIILDNFGAVIRAARLAITTDRTLHEGDILQRGGAALRLLAELDRFSRNRDCKEIAAIMVISDESLESNKPQNIITPSPSSTYPFFHISRYEVIVETPTVDHITRACICATCLRGVTLEADVDIAFMSLSFAPNSAGYINSDIAITIDAAILVAAVRAGSRTSISLCWDDIADAIMSTPPCRFQSLVGEDVSLRSQCYKFTGPRQGIIPAPQWLGIGGCHSAKRELEKAILWPRTRTSEFERFGLNTCRGVILHGPPGNGKTLLARALANEIRATFVGVRSGELMQPYLGESEAAVRELFSAARETAPCILYFDEVDVIGTARGDAESANGSTLHARLVATLLSELDGVHNNNEGVARSSVRDSSLRPQLFGLY